jgi:hypothetical protein
VRAVSDAPSEATVERDPEARHQNLFRRHFRATVRLARLLGADALDVPVGTARSTTSCAQAALANLLEDRSWTQENSSSASTHVGKATELDETTWAAFDRQGRLVHHGRVSTTG